MNLGLLKKTGDALLAESARAGIRNSETLAPLIQPFPRIVGLLAVTQVIDEAMRKFDLSQGTDKEGTACDAWVGPRLHAALRLTRAEASIDEVWTFLAASAFPDYVIWRWPTKTENFNVRVYGSDVKKQAFKRLWWTAELFRNGPDYASATKAFLQSDIPNHLTGMDAAHSRPIALSLLKFLEQNNLGSRVANDLARQLNSSAVTVALDRAYVSQDEATELDEAWLSAEPDLQEILTGPVGPRHGTVAAVDIDLVYTALKDIIDLQKLRNYRRGARDLKSDNVA